MAVLESKYHKHNLKLVAVGGKDVNAPTNEAAAVASGYTSTFRDEVAAMLDEQLVFYRSHLQTDLWTIERELRRREEDRDIEHKQARRALVAAEEQLKPGEILVSESGTPIEFIYKGTPWDMTVATATRRGVPHLGKRSVCYAHGKPIPTAT